MSHDLIHWAQAPLVRSRNGFLSDPFVECRQDMFKQMSNLFDELFDGMVSNRNKLLKTKGSFPKSDVYIADNKLYIELACAGMSEKDIKVEVGRSEYGDAENCVTISGSFSQKREDASYYYKELTQSTFQRSFYIPDNVEKLEPEASMKDGLLTLKWNLKQEEKKKKPDMKQIPIKAT